MFTGSTSTTYLELSQEDGAAHKFYEVAVDGLVVTVRYGRIGAAGKKQTTTIPTAHQARSAAAK
ncbi:WGR domain-containing protein, partial [Streptomyces sp. NPDC057757]|uniref:WGR domain-containing protein n=1 Tax=Streptomyces sp. NPDC057757 TaxID=3346241 RepID=UPI0036A043CD